jgi:hypothetical protein
MGVVSLVLLFRLLGTTPPATAADELHVVRFVVSGDPDAVGSVEPVVRELLSRLPVTLDWLRVAEIDAREVVEYPSSRSAFTVRVWMDLSDRTRARVYIARGDNQRFVLRSIPLRNGYDEVAREALAHVVETAVDAFLSGSNVGMTRDLALREIEGDRRVDDRPAPSVSPPSPDRTPRVAVTLADAATMLSAGATVQQSPLLAASASFPGRASPRFSAWASVAYESPLSWRSSPIGARFYGGALTLAAGAEGNVTTRIVVRALAGLEGERLHVSPIATATDPAATLSPDFWQSSLLATAMFQGVIDLWRPVGILIGAGFDVDLTGTSYVLLRNAQDVGLISPSRVRPFGCVGLSVRLDAMAP